MPEQQTVTTSQERLAVVKGRGSLRDHFRQALKAFLLERAEQFIAGSAFGGDPAALAAFAEEILWATTAERKYDDSTEARVHDVISRTHNKRNRLRHIRMLLRRLNNPKLQAPDQIAYSVKEIQRAKKEFPA